MFAQRRLISGDSNMSVSQGHPSGPPASSAKSGVVAPHSPNLYQKIGAWLVWMLIRGLSASVRFTWTDHSKFFEETGTPPVIFCIWHNRLALALPIYHRYVRKRSSSAGLAAMVSASKDGAFLSAVLSRFKAQPVRGSSSRRGRQALLELVSWAEKGYDLAITPDGPRGPCYVVQDGIISLAQITGLPIIPVSIQIGWNIRPNSWDRFQIPLPFTPCNVIFDQAIHVSREASGPEREELRQLLESRLKTLTKD
jgi:lysophospholipid acyltransferase (LPLAT)-like uncharacterized protein